MRGKRIQAGDKMNQSMEVAKVAIKLAMSSREEEKNLKNDNLKKGIKSVAIDIGGKFPDITTKVLERALVASKKWYYSRCTCTRWCNFRRS